MHFESYLYFIVEDAVEREYSEHRSEVQNAPDFPLYDSQYFLIILVDKHKTQHWNYRHYIQNHHRQTQRKLKAEQLTIWTKSRK